MRRPIKVGLYVGGGLILFLSLLAVTAITIVRSDWFYARVRDRIVEALQTATGGLVEIGRFHFDWKTLTAEIRDLVIHGTEPASGPPLLRTASISAGLKIISVLKKQVDISFLNVDGPRVYLILYPDGRTNVPEPKVMRRAGKPSVDEILDLAVGKFQITNGAVQVQAPGRPPATTPWGAKGENFRSRIFFDRSGPLYRGDLTMNPLLLNWGAYKPVRARVDVSAILERNRLQITNAKLATGESQVDATGNLTNFAAPVAILHYDAKVSANEAGRILQLTSKQSGTVQVAGDARYSQTAPPVLTGAIHAVDLAFAQPGLDARAVRVNSRFRFVSESEYSAQGEVTANSVDLNQGALHLQDVRADSKIDLDPRRVILNGIHIAALGGDIEGNAELRDLDRFQFEGKLDHFDIRQLATLATHEKLPYDGAISGPVSAEGRLSRLSSNDVVANAKLTISPGHNGPPVNGLVEVKYDGPADTLDLGKSFVSLPSTRLDFTGGLGKQLQVRLASTNLNDLLPAILTSSPSAPKTLPIHLQGGAANFNGGVTGTLSNPVLAGHLSVTNFVYEQEKVDSLAADVTAQKTGARLQNGVVTAQNLQAKVDGSIGLSNWKAGDNQALQANVSMQNARMLDVLALAGRKDLPIVGVLSATARVSGTVGNPQATADLSIGKGSAFGEPFDRVTGRITSANNGLQEADVQLNAGPKQVNLKAAFEHAPSDFLAGKINFNVTSNRMQLAEIQNVRRYEPGIGGTVALNVNGSGALSSDKQKHATLQLTAINADVSTNGLQVDNKSLGDAHLVATTQGQTVSARLDSDLANAAIHGQGSWRLTGDYPGTAEVTFTKLDVAAVRPLLLPAKANEILGVGGTVDGKVSFSGPATNYQAWTGSLELARLDLTPLPGKGVNPNLRQFLVRNSGPVRISLANSLMRIESAKFTARNTNLSITGVVALKNEKNPLNLQVNGTVDLTALQTFDPNFVSSGVLAANATVRGMFNDPQIFGRMELQHANLNMLNLPNGVSNANGVILFDGSRATIQTLTAESGGGKVKAGGFVTLSNGALVLRLEANANSVRVRYPQGVSTVADANVTLTGTTERSVLSGDVTILRTGFNPKTDLGSVLSTTSAPVQTSSTQTGFLGNMNFDVQIQTSPDVSFQTGMAEGLQAEANLRLRGTASNPALLGRVNITQGDLTFFGNKYTINQGSIAFYNPVKIDPIVNIDLETRARGVDVTLTVSGPINKLNVSYRSDPPLQFSDIVALLATGRAPADATIAARQTGPTQSWQQAGASAIVGQAIANPVAGRLQRFFGVSKLKIDPLLGSSAAGSGGSNPLARLTLEQQVTPDVTFTYITDVTSTNPQIVRVEWAFSKNWSAVALRDENSNFGIDFLYKKRFK